MIKKNPWFPFWSFDWMQSDTQALMTLAEQGAFIVLLCRMWNTGKCCIADDKDVAKRLCGWTDSDSGDFETVWNTFMPAPNEEGCVTHRKLWHEHLESLSYAKQRSTRTKAATEARRKKAGFATSRQRNDNVTTNVTCPQSQSQSQSQSQENKKSRPAAKRKLFSKPSIEDVQAYCDYRKNKVDAEAFIAFYESKGWKVGRNPMKDWKACVVTWEKREARKGATNAKDNSMKLVREQLKLDSPKKGKQ